MVQSDNDEESGVIIEMEAVLVGLMCYSSLETVYV